MTPKELKLEIANRTGIPSSVVANILDTQEAILTECVERQETCYIGNMFTIRSRFRDFSVIKGGKRALVNKLAVYVKPRKPLRRKLNGKIRRTY